MSGQTIAPDIADLLPELQVTAPAITGQEVAIQTNDAIANPSLENAAMLAADIAAEYGLDGTGQTIAVIDSGIAWDHAAFGNGYGEGHQVVGGWDFAENDANPYDDGPAGFHGSHVAGIIGSQVDGNLGVSSGADLVALRVFDDNGAGDLALVEKALQWVIEHKDDYRFPITTVNLSLGTGWDAANTPDWGSLDDEFAALEADGIFISAAAGNRYKTQDLGEKALSYPAASSYVVPVASHGADGQLSDFSQRDDHVLVAPGERITSSVPDHLFGGTRQDAFVGSSGTSMAAPYVAGASAILRQANEFMGNMGVTQDQLYQQFWDTSDEVFDATTGTSFRRINFRAALEHVIADQYADQLSQATGIGELNSGDMISGTIGKQSDVDAIKFVASETGKIEMTIRSSHELQAMVNFHGKQVTYTGNKISFDVVAGEEYAFDVATTAGTGHYEVDVAYQPGSVAIPQPNIEVTPPSTSEPVETPANQPTNFRSNAIDLGVVVANQANGLQVTGNQSFKASAIRDGVFTVEAELAGDAQAKIEVYDDLGDLLATTEGSGHLRVDFASQGGEQYFVVVSNDGQSQQLDLELTNLVSLENGNLTLHGTNRDDVIDFAVTADQTQFTATINGTNYVWNQDAIATIAIHAHQGNDSVDVALGQQDDHVTLKTNIAHVRNTDFTLTTTGFEHSAVAGGEGNNRLHFLDSTGNDQVAAGHNDAGQTFVSLATADGDESRIATDFNFSHVFSVQLTGSAGSDRVGANNGQTFLSLADSSQFLLDDFHQVAVDGNGGNDTANLFGSDGDDQFELGPGSASVTSENQLLTVTNFDQINATANSLADRLTITDSAGDDSLSWNTTAAFLSGQTLEGDQYSVYAKGFGNARINSIGGQDQANISDTSNSDRFRFEDGQAQLTSQNIDVRVEGFEQVSFVAENGGYDRATVTGSDAAELLQATAGGFSLGGGEHSLRVVGVDRSTVDLGGGENNIQIEGSENIEQLDVRESVAEFESTLQFLRMQNFQQLDFDGNGGGDSVEVDGVLDLLAAVGEEAELVLEKHRVRLSDFSVLDVNSVDQALANFDVDF